MRLFAYMVIALWVLTGLVGSELGLPANEIDLQQILKSPNLSEWAGHDELGRSIGARLALGARTSLFVALLVVTITTVVGTIIGIVAAYFGGWIDLIVSRLMDLFLAFPGILLAIALAAMLGPGLNNLVIALSVVGWVGFARLARAQVLSVKTREHVMAAKALGSGDATIIFQHLLPLIVAPLIIEATFAMAGTIIAEAGLSFLGLGVQAPAASWGGMIRDGTRYMLVAPHMAVMPGLALFAVIISINYLGDRLRDRFDTRQ